jgi:hypothetical protein
MHFELCLYFYYGYFVSTYNQTDILHWELIPVFVRLIFVVVLWVSFCGSETETVHHIICRCKALACQHYTFFGKLFVEPKDISMGLLKDLCLFVRGTGLMNQC